MRGRANRCLLTHVRSWKIITGPTTTGWPTYSDASPSRSPASEPGRPLRLAAEAALFALAQDEPDVVVIRAQAATREPSDEPKQGGHGWSRWAEHPQIRIAAVLVHDLEIVSSRPFA